MKFGVIDIKEHVPTGGRVHLEADEERRDAIRDAFQWSWDAYGKSELSIVPSRLADLRTLRVRNGRAAPDQLWRLQPFRDRPYRLHHR